MRRPTRPSFRRRTALALTALLGLAAALRLIGIRHGLPYPLLSPDERSIVPRAWEIGHGGSLDPGWYDYPSLLIYLLAPVQAPADAPSYLAARLVVAALGVATVAVAWILGRRAYGAAAGWGAAGATAVATAHVAYSHQAVTDVPLTLGVAGALALALAGRLEWAGAAAGLAASAKYPGVLLAVPLAVAGWGEWRRLARAAALALAAFAVTSPFVVLHAGEAWEDASRVQRLARAGWLGFEHDPSAPAAWAGQAWGTLGPALLLAGAGLAVAVVRRSRADLVLGGFALVYVADLLTLGAHFDRYLLPLVPVLGALACSLPRLAPVALASLLVPLAWSIGDDRALLRPDPRVAAQRWLETHVAPGEGVAADPSAPPLDGSRVLRLELPGPGLPSDPRRDVDALRRRVRWVVVTGAVTDRVLAARDAYPREARFYDALRRTRRVLYLPARGPSSPWVAVYDLRRRPG